MFVLQFEATDGLGTILFVYQRYHQTLPFPQTQPEICSSTSSRYIVVNRTRRRTCWPHSVCGVVNNNQHLKVPSAELAGTLVKIGLARRNRR